MRWAGKAAIMAVMIFMTIGGCSRSDIKTVAIDGHVFHVPMKYVVQATVFYLPSSQSDGLTFYINPEAPLKERMIVGMESSTVRCPSGRNLGATPLASACHAAVQKVGSDATQEGVELEKVYSNGDSTPWDGKPTPWWNYRVKDRGGKDQGAVVATCSNGLCDSYGTYGDLVYSAGLRDSEIKQLPLIHRKVHELLSSWEKPSH
jgi:hypothetical protein